MPCPAFSSMAIRAGALVSGFKMSLMILLGREKSWDYLGIRSCISRAVAAMESWTADRAGLKFEQIWPALHSVS